MPGPRTDIKGAARQALVLQRAKDAPGDYDIEFIGDSITELWFASSSRKELTRWILSWMPHVQVVGPGELRDRVRDRLRRGLRQCA